jgi:tRNA A-37 threonylcarbamoyl transferase component Bud32
MAADLSRCPSLGELESLLAERLSSPQRDTVENHVEGCPPCQEQLARLSSGALSPVTLPPSASASGGPDGPDLEPQESFLVRLRELPPPPRVAPGGGRPLPEGATRPLSAEAWLERGRLGQYEILGRIGQGGMGAVFKARHAELGKVVALKVLSSGQLDEALVARFKNEMRALGRLDHPHVVGAHDAGEVGGVHFLVMDFVDGVDLGRLLQRHTHLSIADACEAIRQAALGLQHAFECGLVHRDVKPSNLMLARGGRVQLLDLGLARSLGAAADTLTAKGMVLGTADYLAPEQWEHAHAADIRADIYSLGCTLYHLLAGRPPFDDEQHSSVLQKMRAHVLTRPTPIRQLRPEVPARLAVVLDRMLAKDPADRFAAPAEVAEALRPFTPGSDLGRLLEEDRLATTPAGLAAADVATPGPALRQTDAERGGRGRPAVSSRFALLAALAALCLLLVAASLFWPGPGGSSKEAARPLAIKDLRVLHYREKGSRLLGDLQTSDGAVHVNDDVRVTAELSAPAYFYLIAFNPDGPELVQLCHPEGADGQGAADARPEKAADVRYPRDQSVFILDAVGLQAFVLAASTKPLPPYAQWRRQAGAIPWKGATEGGPWRWYFDGRQFGRYPLERGRLEPKAEAPAPLRTLCEFFKGRAQFDAVRAIAFPVTADRK